jgi:hypothetical protein
MYTPVQKCSIGYAILTLIIPGDQSDDTHGPARPVDTPASYGGARSSIRESRRSERMSLGPPRATHQSWIPDTRLQTHSPGFQTPTFKSIHLWLARSVQTQALRSFRRHIRRWPTLPVRGCPISPSGRWVSDIAVSQKGKAARSRKS